MSTSIHYVLSVQINGEDVRCASHDQVVRLIQLSGDTITLKIVTVDLSQPPTPYYSTMPNRRKSGMKGPFADMYMCSPRETSRLCFSAPLSFLLALSASQAQHVSDIWFSAPAPPRRPPSASLTLAKGRKMAASLAALGRCRGSRRHKYRLWHVAPTYMPILY